MEQSWASVSGGQMRYLAGGTGTPLVLVHGIAASSFSFRFNWKELTRHFRVFVPDLIAVVGSDATELDCSLRASALRLRDFLDEAGIKKADILATSHGGAVTMELASIAPERINRMILVSPANPFARRYHTTLKFYLSAVGRVFVRLVPFMPGRAWNYGIGRMYANPKTMVAGTGLGYARALRPRGATRQILCSLQTLAQDVEDLRAKLPHIAKIPALIIWGDRDPVVEIQSGYSLQRELGADIAVMSDVGHLPYEESPEEFNKIVIEWLEQTT
jgi:pimeloyl-ACP methyl ester carboxylesterase